MPFGVCTGVEFCGVADWDFEGVMFSVGRFEELVLVIVLLLELLASGEELVRVSDVEDMLAVVLRCGG